MIEAHLARNKSMASPIMASGNPAAPQYTTGASGKHLKTMLKKMRRISARRVVSVRQPRSIVEDHEPINLSQRIVLRSYGQVPTPLLVGLHRLYKNDSRRANELLSLTTHNEPTDQQSIVSRNAIRALYEE